MIEYEALPGTPELSKGIRVRILSRFASEFTNNVVYSGEMEDGSDVVVKFSQLDEGAEREFRGLVLANAHDISSPKAISMIRRGERPSTGFIMQRVKGVQLSEVDSIENESRLGSVVSKLHKINLPHYGPLGDRSAKFNSAEAYLNYWIQKTMPYIGEKSEAARFLDKFFTLGKEHILAQEPKLIHRDIQENNVYVQQDGKVVLIDFEWSQGGNPLDDIGVYLYHAIRTNKSQHKTEAFFNGYFKDHRLSSLERYDLLFHLVLAAARTVGFCTRMSRDRLEGAKVDMDKVVSYVNTGQI